MTSNCRACDTPLTRTFVDLKMSPLSNSYVPMANIDHAEKFYPLHTYVCEKCFLVQLAEFESPEHIFSGDYAYFSSFSTSWLEHSKRYAEEMTARFKLDKNSHVVEVASNDGYLLQYFGKAGIPITGIEPTANTAAAAEKIGVPTEVIFFGVETAKDIAKRRGKADLMAANNVLAHVPDIKDFTGGFREMLKPEGVATFEFPHLLSLLEYNQFDTIYHEHFSYLALGPVQQVLATQGLRVFDVAELPTHGGSLRVFACHKDSSHAETPAVAALLKKEGDAGLRDFAVYDAYAEKVMKVKDDILQFLIRARQDGKTVCGYGAPAKGNTLMNYCGIGPEYVSFTVDRAPSKQNTLLPGTRIPVLAVEEIARQKPDYIFILPWNLRTEISKQMEDVRSWGGKFVVAIPKVEVF